MGLALLPWERLPAYVLGPLLFAYCIWLLWIDDQRTFGHVAIEVGGIIFAMFLVWRRYHTGKELLAKEKPLDKA
ncbi:hypothetical protein [Rhizobacter sp. OV335]|jgi:drug/metabolite transporter superfamily protein YnfA|uniref:hypothetical protein n=1 Tax=Rhizobacter sp. OV335 TaxID=1500264 RepID=UPI000913C1CE|nr:hypothetical protein [Rhizobacter sp. OV335]SHM53981.1 hypothetical protein SAMN02787076_01552 [Rhizobacter sp. OV335]